MTRVLSTWLMKKKESLKDCFRILSRASQTSLNDFTFLLNLQRRPAAQLFILDKSDESIVLPSKNHCV